MTTAAAQALCAFLSCCGGNWRNAMFLPCDPCCQPCERRHAGHLLTADRDGKPVVFPVHRLEAALGRRIEPDECVGSLSRAAFEALYARYLQWQLDTSAECPLLRLSGQPFIPSSL